MLADSELHEPLVDDLRVSSFKPDEVIHLDVDHLDASAASARLLQGTARLSRCPFPPCFQHACENFDGGAIRFGATGV